MTQPKWQVETDCATPEVWARMMRLFDDANIYQTWSYGATRWRSKNLSHLVLKRAGEVMAIAQLRIVRPTWLKFGLAYLRWGPLCQRHGIPINSATVAEMARALEEEYVRNRGLLLQIVPNAFLGTLRAEMFQSAFKDFTVHSQPAISPYRTFVVDLAPPLDELRRKLDAKWRNKLTQSEKKGLRVISGSGMDLFRSFTGVYLEMLKRKAFDTTVDIDEFARIQQDLPESDRMRILICEQDGSPAAGLAVSAMGESAVYLLGATSDRGLEAKGAYLLHWTMMQLLKEQGVRWYDLGGIDPEKNPGVYRFKKGFSGTDLSQMSPIAACNSLTSSALVKVGLIAQSLARHVKILQLRLPSRAIVSENRHSSRTTTKPFESFQL